MNEELLTNDHSHSWHTDYYLIDRANSPHGNSSARHRCMSVISEKSIIMGRQTLSQNKSRHATQTCHQRQTLNFTISAAFYSHSWLATFLTSLRQKDKSNASLIIIRAVASIRKETDTINIPAILLLQKISDKNHHASSSVHFRWSEQTGV